MFTSIEPMCNLKNQSSTAILVSPCTHLSIHHPGQEKTDKLPPGMRNQPSVASLISSCSGYNAGYEAMMSIQQPRQENIDELSCKNTITMNGHCSTFLTTTDPYIRVHIQARTHHSWSHRRTHLKLRFKDRWSGSSTYRLYQMIMMSSEKPCRTIPLASPVPGALLHRPNDYQAWNPLSLQVKE